MNLGLNSHLTTKGKNKSTKEGRWERELEEKKKKKNRGKKRGVCVWEREAEV